MHHSAFIFRINQSKKTAWSWTERQYDPFKNQEQHTQWQSITIQKTWIFYSIVAKIVKNYTQG
jgi:hypothetical protein